LVGYINVDLPADLHTVQKRTRVDVYADILHVSFRQNSLDEIRLHHVFEHFGRPAAIRLLIEWYGWLKAGGKLVIETPDWEGSLRLFAQADDLGAQSKILRQLCGSHESEWAFHRDTWYERKFSEFLHALGFGELVFKHAVWNSLANITVTATKLPPERRRDELISAGEGLLRLSIVDDSETEQTMLKVWIRELRSGDFSS